MNWNIVPWLLVVAAFVLIFWPEQPAKLDDDEFEKPIPSRRRPARRRPKEGVRVKDATK